MPKPQRTAPCIALFLLLCCLAASSSFGFDLCFPYSVTSAAVPYAINDPTWQTGLAITNTNTSNATPALQIFFYGEDGTFLGQRHIGGIAAGAQYTATATQLFGQELPVSRFSMSIAHNGTEELGLTTFIWNDAGGFDYCSRASHHQTGYICVQGADLPTPPPSGSTLWWESIYEQISLR